jgi:hypothetical protein
MSYIARMKVLDIDVALSYYDLAKAQHLIKDLETYLSKTKQTIKILPLIKEEYNIILQRQIKYQYIQHGKKLYQIAKSLITNRKFSEAEDAIETLTNFIDHIQPNGEEIQHSVDKLWRKYDRAKRLYALNHTLSN